MIAIQPRRFTVSEYYRMSELGILQPTERTELIAGEIISMAAKGTAHTSAVLLTQDLFKEGLGRRVFVRSQDPIHLSETSEPEPDIVVAVRDPLAYSTHHPTPAEILLVIEVADSSLSYDLKTKAPLYAQASITDYWVLDVIARQLYVFRHPAAGQYQSQTILAAALEIAPLAFADFAIQVAQMLPPQMSA
ncbi:MAG: Uma2 family endonuclease [Leptolyngbyaceae cyanobacterium SM1_1_3]|nr:Uma2 family endonuclease [Leptolyngbyaceae cyanobacterium SM1_1_3]NJN03925.1 Uma2 family endonuclease [Leptolyngbyaceae cyanobacterium RM1_1_2]NJO11274.1 Uma2 family endonuclease [Leptolyngbyaceae cyanobacterium SL_1_1]